MKKISLLILSIFLMTLLVSCKKEDQEKVTEETEKRETVDDSYVNILDYGANGKDTKDDYNAFLKASLSGKSIYVPEGTYYVSKPIDIQNCNLIGAGQFLTKIYSTDTNPNARVIKAGRTCVISDMTIGFKQGIITGNELEGERVGILTGNSRFSLQRGSSIRNCRIENCGTAIYGGNTETEASFSVTYDTLEIIDFTFRGIDFESNIRTGNVYNNIYIISSNYVVDSLFYLAGEESEATFTQINLEHSKARNAMHLENVRAFVINSLHIEGVHIQEEGGSLVNIQNSSGIINAISVYYIALDFKNLSIINCGDNQYEVGSSYKPATVGYLKIGTFHVKGLHSPHVPLWGVREDGLDNPVNAGFEFISRPQNAKNNFVVDVENYVYYTFINDRAKYENFACDRYGKIEFLHKGQIRTSGATSERPTTRLCKNHSMYYDTTLNKLFIYNGTDWVALNA